MYRDETSFKSFDNFSFRNFKKISKKSIQKDFK